MINLAHFTKVNDRTSIVITGMSGTGKSEVILELVNQLHDRDNAFSTIVLDDSSHQALLSSINTTSVINHSSKNQESSECEIFVAALHRMQLKHSLIVIENVDYDTFFGSDQIQACLQQMDRGTMILTTRNRNLASKFMQSSHLIEIPSLTTLKARELLLQHAGRQYGEDKDVDALNSSLNYNPSAIMEAGYRIRSASISADTYHQW